MFFLPVRTLTTIESDVASLINRLLCLADETGHAGLFIATGLSSNSNSQSRHDMLPQPGTTPFVVVPVDGLKVRKS